MQQERNSFVFISTAEAALGRLRQASEFLTLKPLYYASLKMFLNHDKVRPRTVLLDLRTISNEELVLLPKIKRLLRKTQVVGLVENLRDIKSDWYMQHYLTSEMLSTFTLEFFLFQKNFCEFYEISPTDLFPGTLVFFNGYHFLPLNQKYLPIIHENFILTEKKHKRTESLSALYIFRGDSSAYVQYIEKYFDQFGVGLKKRAKAKTYQLLVEWRDLLYSYLLEMREIDSCLTSRPDFAIWLDDLLTYLTNSDDPWSLIYELSRLSCFDVDRSLIEVIVGSYLSRNLGDDEAEKLIDLKLLQTVCRFRVESLLFKRWYLSQEFNSDENAVWNQYPDAISSYKLSPDFPSDVIENLKQYQKQFLTSSNEKASNSRLVYSYLGEVIVAIIQGFPSEGFNKNDLIDSIIVKFKADGKLAEAWLEELRQFLKKTD